MTPLIFSRFQQSMCIQALTETVAARIAKAKAVKIAVARAAETATQQIIIQFDIFLEFYF